MGGKEKCVCGWALTIDQTINGKSEMYGGACWVWVFDRMLRRKSGIEIYGHWSREPKRTICVVFDNPLILEMHYAKWKARNK